MGALPVVVVGGSLAGMAAAARLAKAGHRVRLLERTDRLGGRWAGADLDGHPGVRVDAMPGVLTFPAPWRDLFKKSGRPLDAELARAGLELVPGPPVTHRFADGSELVLPAERAAQHAALTGAYGPAVAGRWRDLVDRLLGIWQQLRPLGMELELSARRQLTPAVGRTLLLDRTVADLADDLADPHLAAVVRSTARRAGSDPERTPAFRAAELVATRTFGRWVLLDRDGRPQPPSRLVELVADRLRLRKVAVELRSPVTALCTRPTPEVEVGGERTGAAAIVSAVDPWTHLRLAPRGLRWADRRRLARARPALAPTVTHTVLDDGAGTPVAEVVEVVEHRDEGLRVEHRRSLGGRTLVSVHDHGTAAPDPSVGIAWDGPGSWWRMPPISTGVPGLWTAGPHSRGGNGLSQVLLSGALASYACHDALSGVPAAPARRVK